MPYTPPSLQSPAASGVPSPVSNGPQLHEAAESPRPSSSPATGRPALPRSSISANYLSRPRRSSSWSEHDPHKLYTFENSRTSSSSPLDSTSDAATSASIHQSPPPVTDSTSMPSGAIISPPDSAQNSSDDDESPRTSSTRIEELERLEKALHTSFKINKTPSSPPNEESSGKKEQDEKQQLHITVPDEARPPPRLSPSARKISHSRSATESSFFDMRSASLQNSQTASDESDEDYDPGNPKPPLLRKKSGELVKPAIRPSSRRKHMSMPGTPTYSKAVHFNEEIEQVRHFLQVDRPIAVSAGASPAEVYEDEVEFPFGERASSNSSNKSTSSTGRDGILEIGLANFPRQSHERLSLPIRVDKISLSTDQKSLIGVVAAANLAFQKLVVARFTFDHWRTTSEVTAEFNNDPKQEPRGDGYDQFNFSINLIDQTNLESKTLLLCVRYNVNGTEYWDNNNSMNFQVDFSRTTPQIDDRSTTSSATNGATTATPTPTPATTPMTTTTSSSTVSSPSPGRFGAQAIPRSRHNSAVSQRPRSMPSFDDDFASSLDSSSLLKFRNRPTSFPDASQRSRGTNASSGQPLASRYDFGASLTAALSQAQAQLGDRSGISMISSNSTSKPSDAPAADVVSGSISGAKALARSGITSSSNSGSDSPRPDTLLANNQTLDSRAYQEFVSKFCFFGSGAKVSPQPQSFVSQQRSTRYLGGMDGAQDESPVNGESNYTHLPEQSDRALTHGPGFGGSYFDATNTSSPSDSPVQGTLSTKDAVYGEGAVSSPFPHTVTGQAIGSIGRAASPVSSFGYPYVRDHQNGIFGSEPHTPQAIHG